ncbi:unnamed protein product [Brassica oleracea var. botrytis]|uniref:Uncharacterized protein n=2 Tax=Brassica TaxID=3705 RepID=A0A3P6DXZ8_BRAOL|nr:uncharacterized protein BNAUNNG01350D [Brassica napus]VDD27934.1 unnamed protein product [Brassica oleracea]KAH0855986.1 hypothetical protein HID58_084247 [Brassica napus]KAH0908399.1 hypothetical protein HID58_031720 [Brassica napus]CAF1715564.1 unnamed protein product [Brassica napus]CDY66178.1 BnaUnng01350D [Brassica napus]
MGCVVSRPETNEGGDYKLITRRGSIGKDSEISESITLDHELSTHSKRSKTGGEKACKEEEDVRENAQEEKGDEHKLSPSPSFRIYCVFPRDPNDDNVVDDLPRNKNISEVNKVESTKQKAHTKFACLKGCVK